MSSKVWSWIKSNPVLVQGVVLAILAGAVGAGYLSDSQSELIISLLVSFGILGGAVVARSEVSKHWPGPESRLAAENRRLKRRLESEEGYGGPGPQHKRRE